MWAGNVGESVPEGITGVSWTSYKLLLQEGEHLVRDGAAKLFLCWTVWTLAQHHQTGVDISELTQLRDTIGKNALAIIRQTCEGRGIGVDPKAGADGIRAILDKDKLTKFAKDKVFASFDTLAGELLIDVVNGKTMYSIASVDWLKLKTWRDVQEFEKTQAQLKRVEKTDTLADHGEPHKSVARMFWGSSGSLERTTHLDLEAGHDLTTYLQKPIKNGTAASPMQVSLLKHWSTILGFQETDHPAARAVLTAFGDPSVSSEVSAGGSLKDFAEALGVWLSVDRKIEPPVVDKAKVSASARNAAPTPANQKAEFVPPAAPTAPPSAPTQPPVGARPVVRVNQHPTSPDKIRLTVGCSGNHLVVKNVDFVIDSVMPDAAYRLCLCSLYVVLTWPMTEEPVFTDSHSSWKSGPDDDVKVVKVFEDGRVHTFELARKDGKLLSPREAIAFRLFTLPAYSLDADLQLKIELQACGAHVKIGRRSDEDHFVLHESREEDVSESMTLERVVEEYKATIEADFPRQPTVATTLGFRIVDITRNDS